MFEKIQTGVFEFEDRFFGQVSKEAKVSHLADSQIPHGTLAHHMDTHACTCA
jgi:hypothetical protein